MTLTVEWQSHHRKAREKPNPAFPNGVDIVMHATPDAPSCKVAIPYPAPECGVWIVACSRCGLRAGVTAAGRPDDPKSLTVPCKPRFDA